MPGLILQQFVLCR